MGESDGGDTLNKLLASCDIRLMLALMSRAVGGGAAGAARAAPLFVPSISTP